MKDLQRSHVIATAAEGMPIIMITSMKNISAEDLGRQVTEVANAAIEKYKNLPLYTQIWDKSLINKTRTTIAKGDN